MRQKLRADKKQICPLLSFGRTEGKMCLRRRCMWYMEGSGSCAVTRMAVQAIRDVRLRALEVGSSDGNPLTLAEVQRVMDGGALEGEGNPPDTSLKDSTPHESKGSTPHESKDSTPNESEDSTPGVRGDGAGQ